MGAQQAAQQQQQLAKVDPIGAELMRRPILGRRSVVAVLWLSWQQVRSALF